MHPQLQEIIDDLNAASDRLHALVDPMSEEEFRRRPEPERWSVAECVEHINLTAEAYLPRLRDAIEFASHSGAEPRRRFRHDPMGWVLLKMLAPPVRVRVKTSAQFVPGADRPKQEVIERFDRLHQEQIETIREADGLPLGRLRIVSPFDERVRYNLYSAFSILPVHEHRHVWQAEKAVEGMKGEG